MPNPDFSSPQPKPTSESENPTPAKPIKGYSDEEAHEIYARAAEIQSESLFRDDEMTPEMLEESANRAGIEDAALYRAIKERDERQKEKGVREAEEKAAQKERAASSAKTRRWVVIGVIVFFALSGLTCLRAQSALGARKAAVEAASAQVDNVLERRHDLIPNLISVTKKTLDNQRALTDALREANEAARKATAPEARQAAESRLDDTISQTVGALQGNSVADSPVVLNLVQEMAGAENRISVERRKYNGAAAEYNRVASSFPVGLAGKLMGFPSSYKLFEASAASREAPKF